MEKSTFQLHADHINIQKVGIECVCVCSRAFASRKGDFFLVCLPQMFCLFKCAMWWEAYAITCFHWTPNSTIFEPCLFVLWKMFIYAYRRNEGMSAFKAISEVFQKSNANNSGYLTEKQWLTHTQPSRFDRHRFCYWQRMRTGRTGIKTSFQSGQDTSNLFLVSLLSFLMRWSFLGYDPFPRPMFNEVNKHADTYAHPTNTL